MDGEGGEGEGEDWILENFLEKKSVQASLPKVFVGIFGSVKILEKHHSLIFKHR